VRVTQDWLLVETLGDQPMVVAQGRQMKNFVPLAVFLRRNPNLAAIQTAIAETVASSTGLASITPKTKRVIRTEPVQMTDGRIHAVHVWCGPTDDEPPERPIPGPLKWDLTDGEGTATTEYLTNAGMDPSQEKLTGRAFVEDIPSKSLNRDESKALSYVIDVAPDRTICATWDFADKLGGYRRVGWCARTLMEPNDDGTEHLIGRAMNLVEAVSDSPLGPENLADRILNGLSQPGVYRMIVDLSTWTLLKWIDDPCPLFDWRGRVEMHPDDREHFAERMSAELEQGMTSAVLRLPAHDGGFVPRHVTISQVELDEGVTGGLVTVRLPTEAELADVGLDQAGQPLV
jgi:hypothetical protein